MEGVHQPPSTNASTPDLVREAVEDARHLIRLEIALARDELTHQIASAKTAAISLGAAAGAFVSSLTMFMVAIAAAFSVISSAALVLGAILLAASSWLGFAGFKALPKEPLGQTRRRLEADLQQLKERVA